MEQTESSGVIRLALVIGGGIVLLGLVAWLGAGLLLPEMGPRDAGTWLSGGLAFLAVAALVTLPLGLLGLVIARLVFGIGREPVAAAVDQSCPDCGHGIDADWDVCPHCGADVVSGDEDDRRALK